MSHDILSMARGGVTLLPKESKRLADYCDRLHSEVVHLRQEVVHLRQEVSRLLDYQRSEEKSARD